MPSCRFGAGKSSKARRLSALHLAGTLRKDGDNRSIVIAVPTSMLGHEQVALFMKLPEVQAAGLIARARLGRERNDPDAPDETMCRDLDAVADANQALMPVETSVCQRMKHGTITHQCKFFEVCGYQRQRKQSADVWLMAHETLFLAKPKEIAEPALVIVDEAPWKAALRGHVRPVCLSLDTLRDDCIIRDNPMGSQRLGFLRIRLADVLAGLSDGPLPRDALLNVGFTVESANEAHALEWQRKIEVEMWPGMPVGVRKEAAKAGAVNQKILRLSMMWRAIAALVRDGGPLASGWAALGIMETTEGAVRVLQLKERREIGQSWQVPTLLLDGTMQLELLKPIWPTAKLTADILVTAPHQHVRQVVDRTYSKRHTAHTANMDDIHAIIGREARRHIQASSWPCCRRKPRRRCASGAICPTTSSWRTTTTSPAGMSGKTLPR